MFDFWLPFNSGFLQNGKHTKEIKKNSYAMISHEWIENGMVIKIMIVYNTLIFMNVTDTV